MDPDPEANGLGGVTTVSLLVFHGRGHHRRRAGRPVSRLNFPRTGSRDCCRIGRHNRRHDCAQRARFLEIGVGPDEAALPWLVVLFGVIASVAGSLAGYEIAVLYEELLPFIIGGLGWGAVVDSDGIDNDRLPHAQL